MTCEPKPPDPAIKFDLPKPEFQWGAFSHSGGVQDPCRRWAVNRRTVRRRLSSVQQHTRRQEQLKRHYSCKTATSLNNRLGTLEFKFRIIAPGLCRLDYGGAVLGCYGLMLFLHVRACIIFRPPPEKLPGGCCPRRRLVLLTQTRWLSRGSDSNNKHKLRCGRITADAITMLYVNAG